MAGSWSKMGGLWSTNSRWRRRGIGRLRAVRGRLGRLCRLCCRLGLFGLGLSLGRGGGEQIEIEGEMLSRCSRLSSFVGRDRGARGGDLRSRLVICRGPVG